MIEGKLRAAAPTRGASLDPARRFAARADREGLLEVAFATADSPVGTLVAASTRRGLVSLSYRELDDVLGELSAHVSPRVLESRRRLDPALRQLDQYFEGRRRSFELPLDWALAEGFTRRVLKAVARIPYGDVSTYGTLAAAVGSPRGARAVGNAVGSNPIGIVVPCHRVVRSGGVMGGYGGGPERKEYLLRLEGAPFKPL